LKARSRHRKGDCDDFAVEMLRRLGVGAVGDGGDARGEAGGQVALSPDPRCQAA